MDSIGASDSKRGKEFKDLAQLQECWNPSDPFALHKGNVDGFAQLLTEHWQESQHIDAGSTNTCIDQIFTVIDDLIDGKMICGAGGGGFLQVVLKKGITRDNLRERLNEVFQDSGVDVWECAFV